MKHHFINESFDFAPEFEALGEKVWPLTQKEPCPSCDGYGTHFRRDLMKTVWLIHTTMNAMKKGIMYRRGAFDEVCTQCNGGKVIDEPTDLPNGR
jgi:DnaJ-class molecular chaperone